MKAPQDWKSGDDPATPSQESYIETLSEQTGEDVPKGLTKAAASEKIDELRAKVGMDDAEDVGPEADEGPDEDARRDVYGVPPILPLPRDE